MTIDTLMGWEKGTEEEDEMVRKAGDEVNKFVRCRWKESDWESAWFVNPEGTQSVPNLDHIHLFARRKFRSGMVGLNVGR